MFTRIIRCSTALAGFPNWCKRVKALGMDSIAITDHGCMFGVIEFFNECKKEGIKPILGMEAYMAPGDRRERSTPAEPGEAAYHLLLLAENLEGYQNLLKLSQHGLSRGVLLQAADRQGNPAGIQRRADRHQRLPRRRNSVGLSQARRQSRQEDRRDLSGNLRAGSVFHRSAEAGHHRAGHGQSGTGGAGQKAGLSGWSRPTTCIS